MFERHVERDSGKAGKKSDVLVALGTGVVRQFEKLPDDSWLGAEESMSFSEGAAIFLSKGLFEAAAGQAPVIFGHGFRERKGVLPLIANLKHVGQQGFAVGETIVAEIEKLGEGVVERGVGAAEAFEGAAGGAGIERGGIFDGLEAAAEAREERAVVGDAQTEGIDGFDGEALRLFEDFPAAALGVCEGCARGGDAGKIVGGKLPTVGRGFKVTENARAHFGGGGAGEGDGEDFLGLVDGGEKAEIAAGKEVGFATTGGCLNDDVPTDVERGFAGFGVGGGVDEELSHRQSPRLRRRRW